VKRRVVNDADAADVTQEILLKLFRLMPGYRRGENQSFRGWLSRIVKNKCTDFYRRHAARNRAYDGAAGGAKPADDPPTPDFVVLEEAEYRLGLIHRTWEVIRSECSEPQALAFEAVYLRRRPVPELAAELRKTENAVFLDARRVLRRLRQRVSELAGLLD
jgi:RNA polymerase sigma factor (sigma-70 family)